MPVNKGQRDAVHKALADGQWHPFPELLAALRPHVRPEVAAREYPRGDPLERPDRGLREILYRVLLNLGTDAQGKGGERIYRLKEESG